MKNLKNHLIIQYNEGIRFDFTFFWGHTVPPDGSIKGTCMSQWYPASFTIDEITYPSAEHYMMSEKATLFDDVKVGKKIRETKEPQKAKILGRQVQNFDNDEWNEHCIDIVIAGNMAKFSQHPKLKEFLLNTGKTIIVEASPYDTVWGIGMGLDHPDINNPGKWKGENLLGFSLMFVRSKLNEQ